MKQLVFTCLFIVLAFGSWAQVDHYQSVNTDRLNKIDQLIKENVATENYSQAADLNKEKKIRLKLLHAYQNNASEEKINEIKSELVNCECTPYSLTKQMDNLQQSINNWNNYTAYRKKNFVLYFEFLVMNYLNTATDSHAPNVILGYDNDVVSYPDPNKRYFEDKFGMGFRIGSSFYFKQNEKTPNLRIGLDVLFLSFTVGMDNDGGDFPLMLPDMIILNFPEPGIVINQFFSDRSGIEYRANVGISKSFGFNLTGMNARLSARAWIGKFSVGLDYQYTTSIINQKINESRVNQLGLSVGMRF